MFGRMSLLQVRWGYFRLWQIRSD